MATIGVTATVKLKHADLYKAAKKLGGQAALARYLGINVNIVGSWCNLDACPPTSPELICKSGNGWWTEEKLRVLETKLLELTGKLLIELFPPELSKAEKFLKSPKQYDVTREVELENLVAYAERVTQRLTSCNPIEAATISELNDNLQVVLNTLPLRYSEIISMRYGLDGKGERSLEEVGVKLGITRERVRQLESKALEKLQTTNRKEMLNDYAPTLSPSSSSISSESSSRPAE